MDKPTREFQFKFVVPTIPKESVEAARRMGQRHPEGSDEAKLASLIIEIADALDTLNNDLSRANDEAWRLARGDRS